MQSKSPLTLNPLEKKLLETYSSIIGIDEVGRGCFAGPMVVAGYKLSLETPIIDGIKDSKLLPKVKRETIHSTLALHEYHIVEISPQSIDTYGLTKCFKDAVFEIYNAFISESHYFLIDGNTKFDDSPNIESIIDGDNLLYSVACASIIGKVYRDNLMSKLHDLYPGYDFPSHVGYGTKKHREAIIKYGPIEGIHRFSYKPLHKYLNK